MKMLVDKLEMSIDRDSVFWNILYGALNVLTEHSGGPINLQLDSAHTCFSHALSNFNPD